MDFTLLLLQFLPLLVYVAVDAFFGYRAGIIAAFAACGFMLAFDYSTTGEIDKFSMGETFLILFMGFVSLRMKNERWFKFQPAVVAVIFAGIFAYFQFVLKKPLLVEYLPHMEKMLKVGQDMQNPEVAAIFANMHTPEYQKALRRMSAGFVWLFGAHALIMAYAALHLRNGAWFLWRLAVYPGIFLLILVTQLTG